MYHNNGTIKFKLDRGDGNKLVMTMSDECTWREVMDNFRFFLKGCGYFLPEDGCICDAPVREVKEEEEDTLVTEEHYIDGVPT